MLISETRRVWKLEGRRETPTQVLQSNGYDNAIIRAGSKELPSRDYTDTEQEKGFILTISYIAWLSESIWRVCRDFDIKTACKSGKTLRQGGRKQIQSGEANISQENLIDIYK